MLKKDISAVLIKKPRKTRTVKKEVPEFVVEPVLRPVLESPQELLSETLVSKNTPDVITELETEETWPSRIVKNRAFNNILVPKFNLLKAIVTERPVLVWLVAMAIGLSIFYWYGVQSVVKDPERVAQEETIKLLAEISKIIVLPNNEIPVIATVNDPVKLSNQPFFTKAKAGDKVLIYPNNKKAILYNPENKKIIEVAPLNIETQN
ncbi:MAG: hypothetical protein A2918_01585 [Candidatus Yanofskybacteria bacterium RIFCSPLOWO2_01_FULL_42_49]|uniref:Uncharacterized protein n=1 Tax=Candidatus Yanofskybacteria bacterium RIFCSPLOWO2_01_FULL_42_49 TaxID=1802694 RepID=A0A1F8GC06_9BACT|nr:MAG: hypothetical protein A2918_01585 [Candidatus Yanofskybacteria bacterium RIFCSPLOWO2_01_FULL_42_49]